MKLDERNKNSASLPYRPTSLSYFGVGAVFVWLNWMCTNHGSLPTFFPWQTIYLVLAVSLAFIAFFRPHRSFSDETHIAFSRKAPVLDWCAAVVMVLACLSLGFAGWVPFGAVLSIAAIVLGGIGLGWTYLRWGLFYSGVDIKHAVLCLFGVGLCWPLVDIALGLLPTLVRCVMVACLPLVAALALKISFREYPKGGEPARRFQPDNLIAMWKVWVIMFAVSFAAAVFVASAAALPVPEGSSLSLAKNLLTSLLCLGVLLWVFKTNLPFDFPLFWRLVMFTLAGGLMLAALNPDLDVLMAFFRAVPGILIPAMWLTVCDIAKRSGDKRCMIVGLGLCIYSLPSFLGARVYASLAEGADTTFISTLLLFFLFVVLGLCLETRDPDIRRIFEDLRGSIHTPSDFETIDERCAYLGQQYSLTQREIEVMQMVCKGRSRTFIAEALFVTENTVKSHVSHIYAKMDIHSKKELQKLVEL